MSRSNRILLRLQVLLAPLDADHRRQFLGAASKTLVPKSRQGHRAPQTGYEVDSPELCSFQDGFNALDAQTLSAPPTAASDFVRDLWFISEARVGRKHRPRDLSKKFTALRSRSRKTLRQLQTPRPARGVRIFFRSIMEIYARRQRAVESRVS